MRKSILRFGLAVACLCAQPLPSRADEMGALIASGYQKLWSGYAAITTCVHDKDRYPLGNYVFVCEYVYEYPYHYGDVNLLAKPLNLNGIAHVSARLCLGEGNKCISGKLFRR